MLDGFASHIVDVGATTIFIRRKGGGPPLLLLHGFPETHVMWHRVAPMLAETFTVVCADLRGYGASGKPPSSTDHAEYSKRAMSLDMVEMMDRQGFSRFSVAGHDRGGRVAYRMALDHSDRVMRLAVLDVVPTSEALDRADARLAFAFWPWSLLAQPAPLPERLIAGDPGAIIDNALGSWGSDARSFPPEVRAAYFDALRDPAAIHAICEEYRAAATLDAEADRRDRQAHRHIDQPTLVLWSEQGALNDWYGNEGGPLGIWRAWAPRVTGKAIKGGHFFPESNATDTAHELLAFFGAGSESLKNDASFFNDSDPLKLA